MWRFLLLVTALFLLGEDWALARVELTLVNRTPVIIEEVYYHQGSVFLALDDVLPALDLKGEWDSAARLYQISTPYGKIAVVPGNSSIRLGSQVMTLPQAPRFIDGRLRVDESFVREYLPALLGLTVTYRDLDPQEPPPSSEVDSLDQFFARLMEKKGIAPAAPANTVVIDPGHGGDDPGSVGLNGATEKDVVLEIARLLEKQIKMKLGLDRVRLTRDSDYALTLEQRLAPVGEAGVAALLQLHAQAAVHPETNGIYLFVRPREESRGGSQPAAGGGSMRLAEALRDALTHAGFNVAGILPAPLLPLGRGDLPTVLLELGYLTNAGDLARLTRPEDQARLIQALFEGLKTFVESR
ncbi:N-acetylmuramoyl-L-alanine amidase [Trichloromonas sp.]|uniref:N-acetylmuramoyl-L-alanine amidase n=1 Tax=Trichloromonas sp. TaxID=3069249 RepID=UPI002A4C0026|nr:N-acetylmuramoyl-L-alanine amidase [Trichloromonas sp.]